MGTPNYFPVQWGDVESEGYRVLSYVGGALAIQRRRDGADVFLQGQDAAELERDIDAAWRARNPARAMRDVLDAYDDVMSVPSR